MSSQKPIEWVNSLLGRFEDQLPYRCGQSSISRINVEQNKEALVNISRYKFQIVVSGLIRILHSITELQKTIGTVSTEIENNFYKSQILVLDALHQCFEQQQQQTTEQSRDDCNNVKTLISEVCLLIDHSNDTQLAEQLKEQARLLLFTTSINNFYAIFNRFSRALELFSKESGGEDVQDLVDIELIQYIKFDLNKLVKLFTEVNEKFKTLKKNVHFVLFTSIEKAIWNWMEKSPEEFMDLQIKQKDTLTECCGKFFDLLDIYCESNVKRRINIWPHQMILLILCPKILEEVNKDNGNHTAGWHKHSRKKTFLDNFKKSIQQSSSSSSKQMTEAGIVACVKLCKAATYINVLDSNNSVFKLKRSVLYDLKNHLFNMSKPFARPQNQQDVELMIDCFIALFRLTTHNNDLLRICIDRNSPYIFHYVLISSLHRISTNPRLPWWPRLDIVFDKAPELRILLADTLNRTASCFNTNHTPLKMMQSLSLKDKMSNLKFKEKTDDLNNYKNLLLVFVRLIQSVPKLMLTNNEFKDNETTGIDCQNSTNEIMNGLVSLIVQSSTSMKDVSDEAMKTILILHETDNIELWNPTEPIRVFWAISSQILHTIANKLIKNQQSNYKEILKWLREILVLRNAFLMRHREYSNLGSHINIVKQAHIKIEQLFLFYLWCVDVPSVVISMSCFQLLCEEAEIRCGQLDGSPINHILPNYQIYTEIYTQSTIVLTGRAALQKRIMALLRRIDKCTPGCLAAWVDTWLYWSHVTKFLMNAKSLKNIENDNLNSEFARNIAKRRQSQSVDHDADSEIIIEWINMTGFLCSLGGVCVLHKQTNQDYVQTENNSRTKSNQSIECIDSINQFIEQLLKLLIWPNEKYGAHINKNVKELIALELNSSLYPILFDQIKLNVDKFFDNQQQVIITEPNTNFIAHIIFIMRQVFENKRENSYTNLNSVTCIEAIMLSIVKYIRNLEQNSFTNIQMKIKFCQLVETMMFKRDDLTFRQEMKFRNKMVEYLSEWVMNSNPTTANECMQSLRDLDLASMQAIGALLAGLPLQPHTEENDRGDIQEAKSQLFLKYFGLFMNLLNVEPEISDDNLLSNHHLASSNPLLQNNLLNGQYGMNYAMSPCLQQQKSLICSQVAVKQQINELRSSTIQAMSNLLSANIDSGLLHSIGLGYHRDLQTRCSFIEVLTKILAQGTEFDMLAENVLADRYEQLVNLVTIVYEKGQDIYELPIAMALASVISTNQMDELARIFVTLFDSKKLLRPLLCNIFYKEVEMSDSMQTLFRGNSLASKIMAFCVKIYGNAYLKALFEPLIDELIRKEPNISFEIDPARIEKGENIERNRENLINFTEKVFGQIVNSLKQFPAPLKLLFRCLHRVLLKRYSNSNQATNVVSTILFLRMFNPVIVSPFESGMFGRQLNSNIRRGLMLMSKILQNIANNVEFSKEQHMLFFNDFLRKNFEVERQWIDNLLSSKEEDYQPQDSMFISDKNMHSIHRLLWSHQEKIGEYLTNSRDLRDKRPFDKMVTLLAYLGPPDCKDFNDSIVNLNSMGEQSFEEIMFEQKMHEKEEFKMLKDLNIFYQAGISKAGNPVFYFISRRYKGCEIDRDLFIYLVIMTLKPYCRKPYELVIDFTHFLSENRFRTEYLQKWFTVLPADAYDKIACTYLLNTNSSVREYIKFHDRFFSVLKGSKKIVFLDNIQRLNDFIEPDQQRLPGGTLALNEDQKVFLNGIRLSNKDTKVNIKVGPSAVQVTSVEKCKILNHSVLLNDVYYASEIEGVCLIDDNQFSLTLVNEKGTLSFIHTDSEAIVQATIHIRTRWELSQTEPVVVHTKIGPREIPGTLLNMALLNLGSSDPILRISAYDLLCALTKTFDLKIDGQLLETPGLCIPSNNTIFIKQISEKLAINASKLTLEFLEECIQGFVSSIFELKHLCLEYMTPWLANLTKFCKHTDENKRQKVVVILDKLISLTVQEVQMYPSIFKIWTHIGQIPDLIDIVLDNFVKRSVQGGLGSLQAEIMADTAVALASSNVKLVASKIIRRLCKIIQEKTSASPTLILEQHLMFNDIAILTRYLLMLSFNDCLDVLSHLPYLFHIITILLHTGSPSLRASVHGLTINIIHSLCTCNNPYFSESTQRTLRLSLDEFSLQKYSVLFGINKIERSSVSNSLSNSNTLISYSKPNSLHQCMSDTQTSSSNVYYLSDFDKLQHIEKITDSFLEIIEECMRDLKDCDWLYKWRELSRMIAFRYNPALQYRGIIVYSCISNTFNDNELKQMFVFLIRCLDSFNNLQLIESIIMGFTRIQPTLPSCSPIHMVLFWVAIFVLQLDEMDLYLAGLQLLEQNLNTLDSLGKFDDKTVEQLMMEAREPLEWHFKQLEISIGISFKSNFHFALVGHLIKSFRHPNQSTISRASRILNTLLKVISKSTGKDKFDVSPDNIAYLTALLPISEEVQSRCHLKHKITRLVDPNTHTPKTASKELLATKSLKIGDESNAIGSFVLKSQQSLPLTCNQIQIYSSEASSGSQSAQKMLSLDLNCLSRKEGSIELQETSELPDSNDQQAKQSSHYLHPPVRNNSHPLQRPRSLSPRNTRIIDSSHLSNSSSTNLNLDQDDVNLSKRDDRKFTQSQKNVQTTSNAYIDINDNQEDYDRKTSSSSKYQTTLDYDKDSKEDKLSMKSIDVILNEENVLLDPDIIKDEKTQALILAVLATLVRNTNDEKETRILYEYLAEGSVVFSKIFPVIHSLLDAKLTSSLSLCHDQVTVRAVQNIIQNMVVGGDIGQQQLHMLYSVGFGGLWRFSSAFSSKGNECGDNAKQFMKCLEQLVNNYLPLEAEDRDSLKSDYKQLSTLTTSKSSVMLSTTHSDKEQSYGRHLRQASMDQTMHMHSGSLSSKSSDNSTFILKKNSSSENDLANFTQ